ncbi:MAG: GntR family transcriptional regulator [Gammaproteobacteria bacterium]|nr:GntR family transcriptional regulator [Gammaproteobacteria bacterium]
MNARFEVLKRAEPLSSRVYATLREYLGSGRIPRGEPLQEAALAAQLGVSRTPVREALVRLASEGFVVADGRGLTSATLTVEDVEEIYGLRVLLETEALRLVARRDHAGEALAPLRAALADMEAAHAAHDGRRFMEANDRYRTVWLGLVPNRRLARSIELYADHVRYLREVTLDDSAVRSGVVERLRQQLAAIGRHDAVAAGRIMREHLLAARAVLLGQFAGAASG